MPEHNSILSILLRSIFIGFGFVIPVISFLKTSDLKKLHIKDLFVLTAVQAVRIGGILYTILFIVQSCLMYSNKNETAWPGSVDYMFFGTYWFVYWFPPAMFLLLSQLLWIKKLYLKKTFLIILSLFLLMLPSYRTIAFIVNIGKGMDAIKFSVVTPFSILEFVLNIIVFIFIIFTIMLAGNKFKKIKE